MRKLLAGLVGLLCLAAVVGCTTNTNVAPATFKTQATLQLAVGTVNDTSHTLSTNMGGFAAATEYLDAIGTFRNQFGNSAFGVGGSTASSPGFAALSPIPAESCNFANGAGCNIGNGPAIGLFGYGQSSTESVCTPGILGLAGCNGMLAAAPAWASAGAPTGLLIDATCTCNGFDMFPIGAGGTQYTLTDTVVINGASQTYSAAAKLNAVPTILAQAAAPAYAPTAGTGGGTITFGAYPAGATEQVAVILNTTGLGFGNFVAAMAEVCTAATSTCSNTALTAVIPANTLSAGAHTCFTIAADFPFVEAGLVTAPAVGTPTPTIVGANGNADMSASASGTCTQT